MSALLKEALLDGPYRYWLHRQWRDLGAAIPFVLWLMVNPSTADHLIDDPTVKKCRGFTDRFGFSRFYVVNLFAYRATDPADLIKAWNDGVDVVGPENDRHITELAEKAALIVCAWGASAPERMRAPRVSRVASLLPAFTNPSRALLDSPSVPKRVAIGYSLDGSPRHPLMMPYHAAAELKPWPARSA